jgi:sigma-B regulation protein RsbU (phosphoserine phosphatase)
LVYIGGVSDETILVVDDEPANLQKLRRTFVNRYHVLAAGSATEALQMVHEHPGIAVIIADQRMPDMTGVELLRRTLEIQPEAIRIILTGYTDVDALIQAINDCRVFRYLVKPWDPPDLLLTVERALEARNLAVENARFRKELIRRERLAQELEIAQKIQRYILPGECPSPEGYEIAVEYHPALEVGGDLYDFSLESEQRLLRAVIGDVSGKSLPAALYGAVFSGQLQALFSRIVPPAEALTILNANLIRRYKVDNYVAVAILQIDLSANTCQFSNAGMPFPYILRNGNISRLSLSGVPLGLLEESVYEPCTVLLLPGDTLVLGSDGTTDNHNPDGEVYDEQRFVESILTHHKEPVSVMARRLHEDIARFAAGGENSDDVTIMAIRRNR